MEFMHSLTPKLLVHVIIFLLSCSNPDKAKEHKMDQGEAGTNNDSIAVVSSDIDVGIIPDNIDTPLTTSQAKINILLTKGTYIEGQLPDLLEFGNWFALVGKAGNLSEIMKIQLSEVRDDPSEGEDYAPTIYITTIPEIIPDPVMLFNSQWLWHTGEIKGRIEEKFLEPESTYDVGFPGFLLMAEGTSTTDDQNVTSYDHYGLMFAKGDHVQQLYSDLSFSSKIPSLIWSGDLNKDEIPDLLFQISVDTSDTEANYQLWLSDPDEEEFLIMVAEHKIYPGA